MLCFRIEPCGQPITHDLLQGSLVGYDKVNIQAFFIIGYHEHELALLVELHLVNEGLFIVPHQSGIPFALVAVQFLGIDLVCNNAG